MPLVRGAPVDRMLRPVHWWIWSDFERRVTKLLRFAEVDNQGYLNMGVDNVSITETAAVPEPAALTLCGIASASMLGYAWRKRRQPPTPAWA